jgi:hypothetical protein
MYLFSQCPHSCFEQSSSIAQLTVMEAESKDMLKSFLTRVAAQERDEVGENLAAAVDYYREVASSLNKHQGADAAYVELTKTQTAKIVTALTQIEGEAATSRAFMDSTKRVAAFLDAAPVAGGGGGGGEQGEGDGDEEPGAAGGNGGGDVDWAAKLRELGAADAVAGAAAASKATAARVKTLHRKLWRIHHNGEPMPSDDAGDDSDEDLEIVGGGEISKCPITTDDMEDPVKNGLCGHIYSRGGIESLLQQTNKKKWKKVLIPCPMPGCDQQVEFATLKADRDTARRLVRARKQAKVDAKNANDNDGDDDDDDGEMDLASQRQPKRKRVR